MTALQFVNGFLQDACIEPQRFTVGDVRELLVKFRKVKDIQLAPSPDTFAEDIWSRTQGHRGLSGLCCSEVEKLVGTRNFLQLTDWQYHAASMLVPAIETRNTYQRMLLELRKMQAPPLELLEQVRAHQRFRKSFDLCW